MLLRPPVSSMALGPMRMNLNLNRTFQRLYPAARGGDTVLHKAARKGLDAMKRMNTLSENPKPNEAANAWLREYYAPFDAELEQWLGHPVPWRS